MATATSALAPALRARLLTTVCSREQLHGCGITESQIRAQLAAHRWQLAGRAIVLHNGVLDRRERWAAAALNTGPRVMLTSFTALEARGLRGWERDEVHLLVHAGAPAVTVPGLSIRLHRTGVWHAARADHGRHRVAPAAVLAAGSFRTARPGIGLLAATVQQRLCRADDLQEALVAAPRIRHRRAMLLSVADIAMGSHALSEIDFVRLCRKAGLPIPERQSVRVEPSGRRRYLDAVWRRKDGSLLAVEVDGSLHLTARHWWSDQLRQNTLVLAGTAVLRFPSVIVREEPTLVMAQLRIALT